MSVTCIVPNYNHARFLPERLDSILEQTRMPDEIILLDDTSSDNSREILQQYAERYPDLITCHFNEENSGTPFAQWKKGVELAHGDFIWIAESDDVADPRLLETLAPMLEADPKVGVAYCQSHTIDEQGGILGDMQFWTDSLGSERWKEPFTSKGSEECMRYLSRINTIPNASAVLFRKAAYRCVGDLPLSFRLCGDWLVWISMLQKHDVSYTPKKLNFYRHHGSTVRNLTGGARYRAESWCVQQYIMSEFTLSATYKSLIVRQQLKHIDSELPSICRETTPQKVTEDFAIKLNHLVEELNEVQAKRFAKNNNLYLPLATRLADYGNKFYTAGNSKLARQFYKASLGFNSNSLRVFMYLASTYSPLSRKLLSKFVN